MVVIKDGGWFRGDGYQKLLSAPEKVYGLLRKLGRAGRKPTTLVKARALESRRKFKQCRSVSRKDWKEGRNGGKEGGKEGREVGMKGGRQGSKYDKDEKEKKKIVFTKEDYEKKINQRRRKSL